MHGMPSYLLLATYDCRPSCSSWLAHALVIWLPSVAAPWPGAYACSPRPSASENFAPAWPQKSKETYAREVSAGFLPLRFLHFRFRSCCHCVHVAQLVSRATCDVRVRHSDYHSDGLSVRCRRTCPQGGQPAQPSLQPAVGSWSKSRRTLTKSSRPLNVALFAVGIFNEKHLAELPPRRICRVHTAKACETIILQRIIQACVRYDWPCAAAIDTSMYRTDGPSTRTTLTSNTCIGFDPTSECDKHTL